MFFFHGKQIGNDTNKIDNEFLAMIVKFFEYKGIIKTQTKQSFFLFLGQYKVLNYQWKIWQIDE